MPLPPPRPDAAALLATVLGAGALGAGLLLSVLLMIRAGVAARRERARRQHAEGQAAAAEAERQRAEEVARDKARLLGMLSHELLTPLQSLWSTLDVIESQGRVDAQDPAFARLRESTRSLRGRIGDLVEFARLSSGRMEPRIRGFQLDKLIDAALRDVAEPLAARNLDVHWDAAPELARRLYADPARLRQVLDNLLSNAVKYTERGGITIHAHLLSEATRLRIEVSDTGVGIRPEDLERIHEPFWRSPATVAMAEGSGLGLAVVRNLVDLLGGTLQVRSRLGDGTSVVLEIPVAPAAEDAAEIAAPAARPDPGLTPARPARPAREPVPR